MTSRHLLLPLAAALLTALPSAASGAEFELEGSFQTRGRLFDSLSLTDLPDLGASEGRALYAEHRLWLRPRILVNEDVRLTLDVKGLDNVPWGERPTTPVSFTNDALYQDGLSAPVGGDPTSVLRDFTLWRMWADIDTSVGRISFGRMPLHWGMGIWQNDGMGLNAEYGDTADRLQFETLVQDTLFVRAAFDTHAENFLNAADDTYAASAAVALRRETLVLGLQAHYRHTDVLDGGNDLDLFTVDAAADAELGKLFVQAEVIGRFGSGDIPGGLNDASISGFGGAIDATLDLNPWRLNVTGGFASGDGDDTDNRVRTFAFDRDHNVGIMLFEQPMPIFAAAAPNSANGNRNTDDVLLGNSIANALYGKATIGRSLVEGLDLEASALLARAAALPDRFTDRAGYGTEILGGVRWTGVQNLEVDGRFGVFLPGTYFRNFRTENIDEGFDRPAFGAQLTGRVVF